MPKLGELRQLPHVEETAGRSDRSASSPSSFGRRVAFAGLGLVALAGAVIAVFCGIRWVLIEVPTTTEAHISELRETYQELSAAELVREYQNIEQLGVSVPAPMRYQVIGEEKRRWGRNALIAAAIALLAVTAAVALVTLGRPRRPSDT